MDTVLVAHRCLFCCNDPREFTPLKPKNKLKDMTGKTFERLFVQHLVGINTLRKAVWCCLCACGTATLVEGPHLRTQNTRSCGCLVAENVNSGQFPKRHGMTNTRVFRIWTGMLTRCLNPRSVSWSDYGARGITVCERWRNFSAFYADMGDPPDGTTLDRKDNSKGYGPENCHWATRFEQDNNKRNNRLIEYGGLTLSIAAWARRQGLPYITLHNRLKSGWDVDKALHEPLQLHKGRRDHAQMAL